MKFDKYIKEKLENRTIAPSRGAWERVADQLRQEGIKKKARIWPKIAIAAGFIGILIFSAPLLFPTERSTAIPLVDIPHDIKSGDDQIIVASEENEKEAQNTDFVSAKAEKETKRTNKRLKNPKNELVINETLPLSQAEIHTQDFVESPKHADRVKNLEPTVEQSVAVEVSRLIAAVQTAEQKGAEVSDYAIDSLLSQAREKIVKERVFEDQPQNLSATALLQSVENELDQSFRERVFDALRDGFMKAREAIVFRNE
jgi:hypothetical protein